MVREPIAESGERFGVVTRVALQLGLGAETLRLWVNQAELERKNRELRRANEILKAASAFFARKRDPRPPSRRRLLGGVPRRQLRQRPRPRACTASGDIPPAEIEALYRRRLEAPDVA